MHYKALYKFTFFLPAVGLLVARVNDVMARWRRQLYRGACWVKRLSNGSTKLVPLLAATEQQRPETLVIRRMRSVEPSHGVSAADDIYAVAAGNVPRACVDHSRCVQATSGLVGVTENQVISTPCDVYCEPVHTHVK